MPCRPPCAIVHAILPRCHAHCPPRSLCVLRSGARPVSFQKRLSRTGQDRKGTQARTKTTGGKNDGEVPSLMAPAHWRRGSTVIGPTVPVTCCWGSVTLVGFGCCLGHGVFGTANLRSRPGRRTSGAGVIIPCDNGQTRRSSHSCFWLISSESQHTASLCAAGGHAGTSPWHSRRCNGCRRRCAATSRPAWCRG